MRWSVKRSLLGAAAAGIVVLAGVALAVVQSVRQPLSIPPDGLWLEVRPGASLAAVARDLADRGALEQPRLLTYVGRARGDATQIKAGEYLLENGLSGLGLLDRLVAGEVHLHQLTVIEGWRFSELLAAVRGHEAISATELDAPQLMEAVGSPGVHPEGQFAPDTYSFPRGTPDVDVLTQAHAAMKTNLETVWASRNPRAVVESSYEALILASIIEKETALASERRAIAGVFNRRLDRGIRLQTDPTVIYGLGEAFDGNLRRADLSRDTPYNTYTRSGLPPTPIAMPGLESLRAAVDPEAGSALYFVASGEPDGSHVFSDTLEQHNRAVARYLERTRRARQ